MKKQYLFILVWIIILLGNSGCKSVSKTATTEPYNYSGRHDFVNRINALGLGVYVVLGEFPTEANARQKVDALQTSGVCRPSFGRVASRDQWYTVLGPFKDMDEAARACSNCKAKEIFKDFYLMTVHD